MLSSIIYVSWARCPMLLFEHEEAFWKRTESLSGDLLGKVGEHEWAAMEKAKGYVFIPGPANFTKVWKNLSKFHAALPILPP